MCLDYIIDKNVKPEASGVGYKIFRKEGLVTYYTVYKLTIEPYHIGDWYDDKRHQDININERIRYPTGYHIYKELDDAKYTREKLGGDCRILEVEYKHVVSEGMEIEPSNDLQILDIQMNVIVARRMKLVKEIL